jgi:phosphoribosyl-ATP pyrophosphohydrolase/phosphoribosyl-AMP cyclohydrolase
MKTPTVDWTKSALVPAIAQDESGAVLMLAWMDREAYELTLSTGFAHYFSRSKQRIWKKGEESGNTQEVLEIRLDCDSDSILLKVHQKGAACHTGERSCFFQNVLMPEPTESERELPNYRVIDQLYHIIQERKNADPDKSYTAQLLSKGDNAVLKKVAEEAGEFAFAIKDDDESEIIYEAADLIFHTLVALASKNIHPDRVESELARRFGMSGIEEKKSRKK